MDTYLAEFDEFLEDYVDYLHVSGSTKFYVQYIVTQWVSISSAIVVLVLIF